MPAEVPFDAAQCDRRSQEGPCFVCSMLAGEAKMDDWAAMVGTISYEVVCGVGPRMPRIVINRPDVPGA